MGVEVVGEEGEEAVGGGGGGGVGGGGWWGSWRRGKRRQGERKGTLGEASGKFTEIVYYLIGNYNSIPCRL